MSTLNTALGIGWIKSNLPYQFRAQLKLEEFWLASLEEITHDLFYMEMHWGWVDFAFASEDDAVAFKLAHGDLIAASGRPFS